MGIDENNSVLALVRSFHRTDCNADGAIAIVAEKRQK
jgi:hypothetical protein